MLDRVQDRSMSTTLKSFFVEVCFIYSLSSRTNIISQTACDHSVANQNVTIIYHNTLYKY